MKTSLEYLKEAISKVMSDADVDAITLETRVADLGIDSLCFAEVMFELEEELGTSFSDEGEIPETIAGLIFLIDQGRK